MTAVAVVVATVIVVGALAEFVEWYGYDQDG